MLLNVAAAAKVATAVHRKGQGKSCTGMGRNMPEFRPQMCDILGRSVRRDGDAFFAAARHPLPLSGHNKKHPYILDTDLPSLMDGRGLYPAPCFFLRCRREFIPSGHFAIYSSSHTFIAVQPMHIEIITTPNETLKESGFGSSEACKSVLGAVQSMGYSTRLNVCRTKDDLDEIVKRKPDLAILAVKYIPVKHGDDIWLSDYFSRHGLNFTGSSRDVLRFDSNKVLAKTHLINKGINTADYFIATPDQYKTEADLPFAFPLFLKPLDAANGNGIDDQSYVTGFSGYKHKLASLYDSFNQPVLVEEYLAGREFTVAIIKAQNKGLITSVVEIIPPVSGNGLRILGAQTKRDDSERLIALDDGILKSRITALAVDAFHALGARDFGRIDIKTNTKGGCYFMEANLVPGMTHGSSYFPEACRVAHAFSYDKVVELVLAGGLSRATSTIPPDMRPDSDKRLVSAI